MKIDPKFLNSAKGKVFYGMHFYPGVAEYEEPGQEPFRVFINESTIRKMNPTFAGCPIYVEHVDEVDDDINEVRSEADGWVLESFYNAADGKHWAKFIIVSDRGLQAVGRGYRLSNAYLMKSEGDGGLWNGVSYRNEVTSGEFEHLAIVRNPRYEESVIMTPDEFKAYNDEKTIELKRLANSKDKKEKTNMGFSLFKKTKVENSSDLTGMAVLLPLSKKEVSVEGALTEYDKFLNMNGYAHGDHMVKINDKEEMSVNDLVKKHMEACNELSDLKKKNESEGDDMDDVENDADMDMEDPAVENDAELELEESSEGEVGDRGGDVHLNSDEEEDEIVPKKKNSKLSAEAKAAADKKALAKVKAARLKNAHLRARDEEVAVVSLPQDQVARGKARYGSK